MRYHFIGIGGAGMSVVAQLLRARGEEISGSDQNDGPTLERLRQAGIEVWVGHDGAHVPAEATVVVSSAIRPTNPELIAARERDQPIIHRSQALAIAAGDQAFVAVAGAHGKTTTSGMLAAALSAAGRDPSFAVGGQVTGFGSGAHLGSGGIFIAEADESDGSFLNYQPTVAVVTNIEADHLDHYGSQEAFFQAFAAFAERIQVGGTLVACADDPQAKMLAEEVAGRGQSVLTYGRQPLGTDSEHLAIHRHAHLTDVRTTPGGLRAHLSLPVAALDSDLVLSVSGEHNALNAAAAVCAGHAVGVPGQLMCESLRHFRGTGRRFEARGTEGGRRLFDDYAHHPTEVAAALKQARETAGEGRVVVLFQPHLFSRTRNFADRFAAALQLADEVIVAPIYPAREDPIEGITSELITRLVPGAHLPASLEEAAHLAARLTGPADLCVTMGAGDVTTAGQTILADWRGAL